MSVLQILAMDSFITYNKAVAKKYGVNSAIILGALCSYQNSFNGEEFFKEQYKICEDTCLSEFEVQTALKILKSNNIIRINKKGLPAKNYYYVIEDKLFELLTTSDLKIRPLDTQKLDHNNNNTINNNTIEENNISKDIYKRKRFVKPTLEEVQAYCKERNNNIDAQSFIDYYESKGWVVGKSPMKDWKSAINTWERNDKSWGKPKDEKPKYYSDPRIDGELI